MNESNPNMRKVVAVETRQYNSMYMEGVVMDCGHWQKMPANVVCDFSNASYRAFVFGERFVSCRHCAKQRREANRVPNLN